jgi:hypothetical protein
MRVDRHGVQLLHVSRLNEVVQELIGDYISMEEYYMIVNVNKAVDIDEIIPDNLTSTMVDDVFYILKKCSERAFGTVSPSSACAMINHICAQLNGRYKRVLQQSLEKQFQQLDSFVSQLGKEFGVNINLNGVLGGGGGGGNGGGDALQEGGAGGKNGISQLELTMFTMCNNLCVSAQNMQTLKVHLDGQFQEIFGGNSSSSSSISSRYVFFSCWYGCRSCCRRVYSQLFLPTTSTSNTTTSTTTTVAVAVIVIRRL